MQKINGEYQGMRKEDKYVTVREINLVGIKAMRDFWGYPFNC
jgi:hypothetical protein